MLLVVVETSISPPLIYITEIVRNVRITTNVPPTYIPLPLLHIVVTHPGSSRHVSAPIAWTNSGCAVGRFIAVLLCALPVHMLVVEVGVEPDLQEKSDQQLLILAREDSRAFAVLYGRHHHHIYSYALGILHDRDLAEDVAEETLHGSPATLAGSPRHTGLCCHGCTAWRATVRWTNYGGENEKDCSASQTSRAATLTMTR